MNQLAPAVTTGISAPHAGEARPLRSVASVRQSRQPFSGDLTGVLRETPVAPVGRGGGVGSGQGTRNHRRAGWLSLLIGLGLLVADRTSLGAEAGQVDIFPTTGRHEAGGLTPPLLQCSTLPGELGPGIYTPMFPSWAVVVNGGLLTDWVPAGAAVAVTNWK